MFITICRWTSFFGVLLIICLLGINNLTDNAVLRFILGLLLGWFGMKLAIAIGWIKP